MAQTSTVALVLLMVSALVVNFQAIVGVIGTGAIIAILIFLLVALVLGFFLGGKDGGTKSVLGLGTAQRNLSAALVVRVHLPEEDQYAQGADSQGIR